MNTESMLPQEKIKPKVITETSQMTSWFGKDRTGKDVVVEESILIDLLEQYFKSKDLLEHCKQNDWVVLPDDTRLVCSLQGAVEKKWSDIYIVLKSVIDNHNSKVS